LDLHQASTTNWLSRCDFNWSRRRQFGWSVRPFIIQTLTDSLKKLVSALITHWVQPTDTRAGIIYLSPLMSIRKIFRVSELDHENGILAIERIKTNLSSPGIPMQMLRHPNIYRIINI
jgi:hypothetical protein